MKKNPGTFPGLSLWNTFTTRWGAHPAAPARQVCCGARPTDRVARSPTQSRHRRRRVHLPRRLQRRKYHPQAAQLAAGVAGRGLEAACTCSSTHPQQLEHAVHGPQPGLLNTRNGQMAVAAAAARVQTFEPGLRATCMNAAALIWLHCLPLSSVTLALRGEKQRTQTKARM